MTLEGYSVNLATPPEYSGTALQHYLDLESKALTTLTSLCVLVQANNLSLPQNGDLYQ
jgi:hypothetical protein